jgi:hypothetical protein
MQIAIILALNRAKLAQALSNRGKPRCRSNGCVSPHDADPVCSHCRLNAATRCATSADKPGLINPITGIPDCCAIAASGHALTEPRIPLMSSRRRIAFPKAQSGATWLCNYSRDLRLAKWGDILIVWANVRFRGAAEPRPNAMRSSRLNRELQPKAWDGPACISCR